MGILTLQFLAPLDLISVGRGDCIQSHGYGLEGGRTWVQSQDLNVQQTGERYAQRSLLFVGSAFCHSDSAKVTCGRSRAGAIYPLSSFPC
jgi:hypothetical protein